MNGKMFRSMTMTSATPDLPMVPARPIQLAHRQHSSDPKDLHEATVDMSQMDVSGRVWIWKLERISPVPLFHKVQWNALTVEGVGLDRLTRRIAEFLRLNSIAASFERSGRVHCATTNILKFVIQLWQGSSPEITVIEIQRIQGDSFELQRYRIALYEAIQTDGILLPPSATCSLDATETCNNRIETILSISVGEVSSLFPSALEICIEMVHSQQFHEQRIGLDTLVALTDINSTIPEEVMKASHRVITGVELQSVLMNWIAITRGRTTRGVQYFASSHDMLVEGERDTTCSTSSFHLLVLRILANSLESTVRHPYSCNGSQGLHLESDFWNQALQVFVQNVSLCRERSLEACVSARCLRLLNTLHPNTIRQSFLNGTTLKAFENAHQQGCRFSLSLEHETKGLLEGLGMSVS